MCVHLCNYKFDGLILMVGLDFKTSWKMFTQRGEYVAWMFWVIISEALVANGISSDL